MPKINREEYEVLKELDAKWKWIARDEDRGLYAFTEKPVRNYGPSPYWWDKEGWDAEPYSAIDLFDEKHLFQFIQWEDGEPYNIAELIKEYKSSLIKSTPWTPNPLDFESDDDKRGVGKMKKDKEWMKEEFKKLERTGVIDSWVYRDLWMMANQLDEPEVLSLEWIDEHRKSYTMEDSVEISDLQNLLVPKQEELESTIKVLIEAYKQEEDAHGELENGWIRGFIKDLKNLVEEEPLYYVLDSDDVPLLERVDNQAQKTITRLSIYEKGRDRYRFELTEQEIKDHDSRYWPFAVPVEVAE